MSNIINVYHIFRNLKQKGSKKILNALNCDGVFTYTILVHINQVSRIHCQSQNKQYMLQKKNFLLKNSEPQELIKNKEDPSQEYKYADTIIHFLSTRLSRVLGELDFDQRLKKKKEN